MKKHLTNERLKSMFKNNFELANYAIEIGREFIGTGEVMPLDDLIEEIISRAKQDMEEEKKNKEEEDKKNGA